DWAQAADGGAHVRVDLAAPTVRAARQDHRVTDPDQRRGGDPVVLGVPRELPLDREGAAALRRVHHRDRDRRERTGARGRALGAGPLADPARRPGRPAPGPARDSVRDGRVNPCGFWSSTTTTRSSTTSCSTSGSWARTARYAATTRSPSPAWSGCAPTGCCCHPVRARRNGPASAWTWSRRTRAGYRSWACAWATR